MARKTLKRPSIIQKEIAGTKLSFIFAPTIGRASLDELQTDLDLITKIQAMDLHAVLRFSDNSVVRQVTDAVSNEFTGRRGSSLVLQVPLPNSRGQRGRHLLFFGLGSCQCYDGRIVCETFETFFQRALELGAETVTVPFPPKPMTGLSHKATTYKLKDLLHQVLDGWTGEVKLRQIKLWCTPPAVPHIEFALKDDEAAPRYRCCLRDQAGSKREKIILDQAAVETPEPPPVLSDVAPGELSASVPQ